MGKNPKSHSGQSSELARAALQLLTLGTLVVASFWVIKPFIVALVWAATMAVATWPLLLRMQGWFGGRRVVAVGLMTTLLSLIVITPFYLTITTIVENIEEIAVWSRSLATLTLLGPPAWINSIPLFGVRVATRWQQLAAAGPGEISAHLSPFAHTLVLWLVGQIGNLGQLALQLVLTVIITGVLYSQGESAAYLTKRFIHRLAGSAGDDAVRLAVQAVRAVALGIVGTAIVQSVLAGVGLVVVGVPFPMFLTAIMFALALAQIGPAPVLIGAVIWLYVKYGALWGTGFLVWALFCMTLDNLLRPLLIKRNAGLPLFLILIGVIGGLIGFGVIGLFIGPVVLAVSYTLLTEWLSEEEVSVTSIT